MVSLVYHARGAPDDDGHFCGAPINTDHYSIPDPVAFIDKYYNPFVIEAERYSDAFVCQVCAEIGAAIPIRSRSDFEVWICVSCKVIQAHKLESSGSCMRCGGFPVDAGVDLR